MPHEHEEHHDHTHEHGHAHDPGAMLREGMSSLKRLWIAMAINMVFLIAEFVGGLLTGSLALLSDAGHMLTDVAALALAIVAAHLAARPPTGRRTFGFLRAEVIGAFLNGTTLVVIVALIVYEASRRIGQAQQIDAPLMLVIAGLGLGANFASAAVLWPSRGESLNIEGAFLHLAADALGSIGAVVAGVVIWTTAWTPIDLIASGVIGVLILWSGVRLLGQALNILLNATPPELSYHEIKEALEHVPHFDEVRDLHIWSVVSGINVLTAHIRLEPGCSDSDHWQKCLQIAQSMLHERFGIEHSTLQLEPPTHPRDGREV